MPSEGNPPARSALEAAGARVHLPATSRLWDLAGGGKDHFKADRALYEEITQITSMPLKWLAAANTHFVHGAAEYVAAELGSAQYIDLGVGIPSRTGNLHHLVQPLVEKAEDAEAKVVYVDQDPIVLAHARALLADDYRLVRVVDGDVFEPAELLRQDELVEFLDWDQPIALFCTAVLHYHPGSAADAAAVMQTYVDALPVGSCTVITHFHDPGEWYSDSLRQIEEAFTSSGLGPGWFRTKADIESMFPGQTLIQPGIALCCEWWPDLESKVRDVWVQECIAGGIGQKEGQR